MCCFADGRRAAARTLSQALWSSRCCFGCSDAFRCRIWKLAAGTALAEMELNAERPLNSARWNGIERWCGELARDHVYSKWRCSFRTPTTRPQNTCTNPTCEHRAPPGLHYSAPAQQWSASVGSESCCTRHATQRNDQQAMGATAGLTEREHNESKSMRGDGTEAAPSNEQQLQQREADTQLT